MSRSRRNRNRSSRSKRSRRNRRSRNSSRRRRRRNSGNQRGGSGFGAIIKEAIVPIAFLGTNIKLKKKVFGNKTVMIPIFKNMKQAKYDRDRGVSGRRKSRRRKSRRRKRTRRRRRRRRR